MIELLKTAERIPICPMAYQYNTAQYVLLLFANSLLVVSTLLFHYSFHGLEI